MRKFAAISGLLALTLAGPANAQVLCAFTGSGSTGPDCAGNTWTVVNNSGVTGDGFGIPGILLSVTAFGGSVPATDFHITFTPSGSFDGLIGTLGAGFDTRFEVLSTGNFWNAVVSGNTVDFFANPGDQLDPGASFFVNVAFLNGFPSNVNDVSFQASWTNGSVAVTPEPATMTLVATGLVSMAGLARRRNKKV